MGSDLNPECVTEPSQCVPLGIASADLVAQSGLPNQVFQTAAEGSGFLGNTLDIIGLDLPGLSVFDVLANEGNFITNPSVDTGLEFAASVIGAACPLAGRLMAAEYFAGAYFKQVIEGPPGNLSPEEWEILVRYGTQVPRD